MSKQTAVIVTYEKEGTDEIRITKVTDENGNVSNFYYVKHKPVLDYANQHFDNWNLQKIVGRVQYTNELKCHNGMIVIFNSWR